jgi:hypothetical protein
MFSSIDNLAGFIRALTIFAIFIFAVAVLK